MYLLRKVMADNNSKVGGEVLPWQVSVRVIIVQVLVMIFLCINFFLIITFFQQECFYKTARYILFAVTLLSDSFILLMSNILLIFDFLQFKMNVWLCIIICAGILPYVTVTPVTLTAMTLERYVAICMPLRHAELCSIRSIMHCILIIHSLSYVPYLVVFSTFFALAPFSLYKQYKICSVEMFIFTKWQNHLRSAIHQFYFLIMCIIIVFAYVKIMKVAKAASGEDKKSMWKGLRTVILHAFQLLLCLLQFWCPIIESMFQVNTRLFRTVRYCNYILFNLSPRCLSPLTYGLRDEKFFQALKKYAFFGLYKRNI